MICRLHVKAAVHKKTAIHCLDMYLNVTLIDVQSLYILLCNLYRHVVLLCINLPVKQSTCPTSPATHQSEQSAASPHFILSACLSAHSFTRRQISHCHCLIFVGKLSISGRWQNLSAGLFIIIHVEMKTLSAVSRCHMSLFIFSEVDICRFKQMTLCQLCSIQ